MKNLPLLAIILSVFLMTAFKVDSTKKFPSTDLKTLAGESINTSEFIDNGKLTVFSFWASWCKPCKAELDAIADIYPDWQEEYNMELVAITVDNARGLAKVPGIVNSKGWEYTVLSDANQSLQRMLNFQAIPQTFVVNAAGEIVYEHSGYKAGDEDELEDVLASLAK